MLLYDRWLKNDLDRIKTSVIEFDGGWNGGYVVVGTVEVCLSEAIMIEGPRGLVAPNRGRCFLFVAIGRCLLGQHWMSQHMPCPTR